MKADWTSAADIPSLQGKVVIVTGANAGIGREITKKLAKNGATVIMGCRTVSKAEPVKEEILAELGVGDIKIIEIDVSSFDSVRKFVDAFQAQYTSLDLLMCNAGILGGDDRSESVDGFEMQLATNHTGHYLLVGLLLPLLKKSPGSRVVMHSSLGHWYGSFNWDDIEAKEKYNNHMRYAMTKLANIAYTVELQKRLTAAGVQSPTVLCAHPGATIGTQLQRDIDVNFFLRQVENFLRIIGCSLEEGAQPALFALTSPEAEAGGYYAPGTYMEFGGKHPKKTNPKKSALDPENGQKLFEYSETATGFKYAI